MKRIWHKFDLWEDYHNGMYEDKCENPELSIELAKRLLSDTLNLECAMMEVINEWKFATEFNLSNITLNRQAWLGQSACSIRHNCNEKYTKLAWNLLSEKEQILANNVADKVIKIFEENI